MIFKMPEDWDELTCINHLQRKIILLSIAYYEFDYSPISDSDYDELAQELARRMRACENVEESRYWYAFKDYDGSTGYFLYSRLTAEDRLYLRNIAAIGLDGMGRFDIS